MRFKKFFVLMSDIKKSFFRSFGNVGMLHFAELAEIEQQAYEMYLDLTDSKPASDGTWPKTPSLEDIALADQMVREHLRVKFTTMQHI